MDSIGIRELRQNASRYVAAAARGESMMVTDRGDPVAQLVPLSPLENQIAEQLASLGLTAPTRGRRHFATDERLQAQPLSPLLDDDRAERVG